FVIPPDITYTLDRQGSVRILEAVAEGRRITTQVALPQGRLREDVARIPTTLPADVMPEIQGPGLEHRSTIVGPNTALAVRGTEVSLRDQAPFTPEAVSLTGRAVYYN